MCDISHTRYIALAIYFFCGPLTKNVLQKNAFQLLEGLPPTCSIQYFIDLIFGASIEMFFLTNYLHIKLLN